VCGCESGAGCAAQRTRHAPAACCAPCSPPPPPPPPPPLSHAPGTRCHGRAVLCPSTSHTGSTGPRKPRPSRAQACRVSKGAKCFDAPAHRL
jgi:hypothetical protein